MAKKNKKKSAAKKASSKQLPKLSRKDYEEELKELQGELVKLQYWVRKTGAKVIILFEGRDAAGKGGLSNASRSG
jgi:polyphosphate kinase 2 (PPK2 family)